MSAQPALRPPARRTGLWITGILASAIVFFAIYEYFVRSYTGQLIEFALLNASENFELPIPALDLSIPGNMLLVVAIPAALFIAIALARQKFLAALIAVGAVVGANISTQVLKQAWLEKPLLVDGPEWPSYWENNTLPSGHTTLATSIAVAVFLIASPRQRPIIAVLIAFYAGIVGAYTYIETWHTPADAISAYFVVAAWALAGGWLIMRADARNNTVLHDNPPNVAPAAGFCWFLGIVVTVGGVLTMVFGGGWTTMANSWESSNLWHWFAGALMSFGPGFLVSGAAINFFGAETGRRQRGAEVPNPKADPLAYPVPTELRELYERV